MEDIVKALKDTLEAWKQENHVGQDLDWKPLEALIPADWWGGFMYMGSMPGPEGRIHMYKHGITRRYLNISDNGQCWLYASVPGTYHEIDSISAVLRVYEGIEGLGATPSTVYDADYRAKRDAALAAAGYKVIG